MKIYQRRTVLITRYKKFSLFILLIVVSLTLTLTALLSLIFPEGVWVQNGNTSHVPPNSSFTQTLYITNLSPYPIFVSTLPTCGCTMTKTHHETIPRFGCRAISVSVATIGLKPGEYKREVILLFESHNKVWDCHTSINFHVI